LANKIRKEFDGYLLFLRSNGPPTLQELADVIGWIASIPPRIPVISDRLTILSEAIYGPILRGKCIHGLSIEQMARWIKARPAMIIYCRPNYSALAAGMRQETQMDGVHANHQRIVKAYDELMGKLEQESVQVTRYDYTGPPQLVLDSIRTFIRGKNNGH